MTRDSSSTAVRSLTAPKRRCPAAPTALAALVALATLPLQGCDDAEQVRQMPFRDLTPHEAYGASLQASGLAETALGREWLVAGRRAIEQPAPVSLPFEEEGYIAPDDAGAAAYRFTIPPGTKLAGEITLAEEDEDVRVFLDLFQVGDDASAVSRPLVSTDRLPGTFVHEPWRGGDFVLRIQPELLRGGRYRVALRLQSQLAFPVDGRDMRAIQSFFGADRDAGARRHEGVDIFARRGTPVVAAAPGRAYRIGVTNLGGKVVWVRDDIHNARLYYAHLDSQAVVDGQRIEIGDTLGFVGNTGNARTTPPHLHFGVYRSGRGAVDPFPFLRPAGGSLPPLTADLGQLGRWVRPLRDGVRLRAAPGEEAPVLEELPRDAEARVLGGTGGYFRVSLGNGEAGYVPAGLTEPLDEPTGVRVAGGRPASADEAAARTRGATQ